MSAPADITASRTAGEQPGPSGLSLAFATVAMFAFVGVIFALLGTGGWVAVGAAIAVMVLGVVAVSRYVQWISLTRSSPLPSSDEAQTGLSRHDFPLDKLPRATCSSNSGGAKGSCERARSRALEACAVAKHGSRAADGTRRAADGPCRGRRREIRRAPLSERAH